MVGYGLLLPNEVNHKKKTNIKQHKLEMVGKLQEKEKPSTRSRSKMGHKDNEITIKKLRDVNDIIKELSCIVECPVITRTRNY